MVIVRFAKAGGVGFMALPFNKLCNYSSLNLCRSENPTVVKFSRMSGK